MNIIQVCEYIKKNPIHKPDEYIFQLVLEFIKPKLEKIYLKYEFSIDDIYIFIRCMELEDYCFNDFSNYIMNRCHKKDYIWGYQMFSEVKEIIVYNPNCF
jgi:hypothetical protein